MGDDDDRGLEFLRQAVEDRHHSERAFAVERRGRLVGEDDRRLVGECPRDRHALLFAAREFGDARLRTVLHVERSEHLQRSRTRLGIGDAGQHRQQRDVVGGIEKGDQIRRLEHESDTVAAQRAQIVGLPVAVEDHFAAECEPAGGRLDHCTQAFQQGGLAGAGRPDQADHLAGPDRHVDALQRIDRRAAATVALGEALDENRGLD